MGMLVYRLTISKLHIKGTDDNDINLSTKLKESLTVYSLVAKGFIISDRYLAKLCEYLPTADTIGRRGTSGLCSLGRP